MNKSAKLGWKNWLEYYFDWLHCPQLPGRSKINTSILWVYSQSQNAEHYITWMTMASAVAATLTTFFMGSLSDRLGKRKIFIAGGYVIWGVTVFLFGVMSRQQYGSGSPGSPAHSCSWPGS
jgi:MFS family permease